jgi:hypothetical protein
MAHVEDYPSPVAKPAEKPDKRGSADAAQPEKSDGPSDTLVTMAQAAKDAAKKANKNAERAYKSTEDATNSAAVANGVALSAKSIAVIGALFGAAATVVALLAVYGTLIGN